MKSYRIVLLLLALLGPGSLPSWTYDYFGRYNTAVSPNTFIPERYDVTKLPNSTLTFYLTDQKPAAMAPGDSVEALMSEIAAAASNWNNVSTSSLRVNFGGYFRNATSEVSNPIGIVSFTTSLPPGAAAVGGPLFTLSSSGNPPAFFPIGASRIQLPADMSKTSTSSLEFLTIVTHEMGHALGTSHSHVAAVMFQTALTSRARALTEDDVALISFLYPAPSFATTTGSISGRVTTTAGPGASIVGVSAFTDSVVIGAFTNPDGSFTINGLPPGSYKLMVQPLPLGAAPSSNADNPGDPDDLITTRTLTNAKVTINTNIDSAFFAGGGATTRDPAAAAIFPVNAGATTAGANITIGSRGPLRLETDYTFSFPLNADLGPGLIWNTRGGKVTGASAGKALDAAGLTIGFTNPAVSFVPGSLQTFKSSNPNEVFNISAFFMLQSVAGAVPGSSSVIYTNGADAYFSPGHVRVVTSDPPKITSLSPASGAANTAVTISGSNFTASSQVYFDGVLAKVTSQSPTSLVTLAPPAAGGHAARVFVANPDGQGSEFLSTPPTFTYAAAPQPSVSVTPSGAAVSQTLTVTVTGTNTNFQQGMTVVGFGSGDVVVNSVTVQSATSLLASIKVQSFVAARTFAVTVVTGEEVAYLDNALTLATQAPFILEPISGNLQASTAGSILPRPLIALAEDANGIPISGVTVTFTVTLGGGSVSPATAVTDVNGQAQTTMTLGPAAGIQMVTATAAQFASTGFMEAVGTTSAFSLRIATGGSGQTGTVNSDLPAPLTLTVTDVGGTPLPGVPIGWLVTAGGGSVRPSPAVTDGSGKVSATWTLGSLVGSQSVQAIAFLYFGSSPFGGGPTFTATAQRGSGPTPSFPNNGILNGAGFDSAVAGLSPGAIASIFGSNLSTAPTAGVQPGLVPGTSMLRTNSNGTTVTFDGVAAPLFFVSPAQLNVQVPFEVAGKTSSQVVVSVNGNSSPPVTVSVLPATPALFTADSSGKGAAVLLNQDGSVNSASNPAPAGTVIQLFATGLGALSPPGLTGQLAPTTEPLARSVSIPTVTIGGAAASVQFSGLAPGFVGLWQVNATVPSGIGSGSVPLLLNVGGQSANPVSIFVK